MPEKYTWEMHEKWLADAPRREARAWALDDTIAKLQAERKAMGYIRPRDSYPCTCGGNHKYAGSWCEEQ
jgi:hypothetical protein